MTVVSPILPCPAATVLPECPDRAWTRKAIDLLEADARRSADTHLVNPKFPGLKGISIYLKDESTHPTGSLKHRLAHSLILFGICNGNIKKGTTLVEASSGSTAVSEAYYAQILGLPFIAVMTKSTSKQKVEAIQQYGGTCHFVNLPGEVYDVAEKLAAENNGYYLDQFTNAERAYDWRCGNAADSIMKQMSLEANPVPTWIVVSAGTGGTATMFGRYLRYKNLPTRLCVTDVEFSAFYDCYQTGNRGATCDRPSRVEGIGRPRVEPSFMPDVVDHMIKVPDAASIAAMRVLSKRLGRRVGGSTGTNFFGLCWISAHMMQAGEEGSLVSLICDGGERYTATYYDDAWLAANNINIAPYCEMLEHFLDTGEFDFSVGAKVAAA